MPAWRGNRLVVLRQNPSPQGPGGWPIGILNLAHRAEIRITGRRGPCLCSRQGGSSGVIRDASYALPTLLLYRDCFTLCPRLWQRPIAYYVLIRVLRAYSRRTRLFASYVLMAFHAWRSRFAFYNWRSLSPACGALSHILSHLLFASFAHRIPGSRAKEPLHRPCRLRPPPRPRARARLRRVVRHRPPPLLLAPRCRLPQLAPPRRQPSATRLVPERAQLPTTPTPGNTRLSRPRSWLATTTTSLQRRASGGVARTLVQPLAHRHALGRRLVLRPAQKQVRRARRKSATSLPHRRPRHVGARAVHWHLRVGPARRFDRARRHRAGWVLCPQRRALPPQYRTRGLGARQPAPLSGSTARPPTASLGRPPSSLARQSKPNSLSSRQHRQHGAIPLPWDGRRPRRPRGKSAGQRPARRNPRAARMVPMWRRAAAAERSATDGTTALTRI